MMRRNESGDVMAESKQLLHFVFGGELNAAIIKSQLPHGVSLQAAQSLKPSETQA